VKLAFLALAASIQPLSAQDPPSAIIYVYREQIKPGKIAAYSRIEEGAARFCARANCPNPYFAITSITGPNEALSINGFDSIDAMEKVWHDYAANQEITQELNSVAEKKADLAFPATNLIARYREEMSFAPSIAPRFLSITVLHLRPGHAAAFRGMRAPFKQILERAGRPQWVYQVTSGTEDDAFLIVTPARTMQEIYSTPSPTDRNDAVADLIVSSETRLYAVSPSMSMPAPSWVEADPEFWKRPE
jgi:hypothetical protein